MSKEIEQRIIEKYEEYVTYLKQYLTAFEQVSIPVLAFESELSRLRAAQGEKETETCQNCKHSQKHWEQYPCIECPNGEKWEAKISVSAKKAHTEKPVEQSKLSAEEILREFEKIDNPFYPNSMRWLPDSLIKLIKFTLSKFEGKELPEEELRRELVEKWAEEKSWVCTRNAGVLDRYKKDALIEGVKAILTGEIAEYIKKEKGKTL